MAKGGGLYPSRNFVGLSGMLKDHHLNIQALFRRYHGSAPESRAAIVQEILLRLRSHLAMERTVYAVVRHSLELEGTLKSCVVTKCLSLDQGHKRLAMHVGDHPLDYATLEGIIPAKQYGAGTVLLWDRGDWTAIGDPGQVIEGRLKFRLDGEKLHGIWNLVRMGAQRSGKRQLAAVQRKG